MDQKQTETGQNGPETTEKARVVRWKSEKQAYEVTYSDDGYKVVATGNGPNANWYPREEFTQPSIAAIARRCQMPEGAAEFARVAVRLAALVIQL